MFKKIMLACALTLASAMASAAFVSHNNWEVDEATIKTANGKLSYVAMMDYGDTMFEVHVKDGKPALYIMRKNTGKSEPHDDADTLQLYLDARGDLEKLFKQ